MTDPDGPAPDEDVDPQIIAALAAFASLERMKSEPRPPTRWDGLRETMAGLLAFVLIVCMATVVLGHRAWLEAGHEEGRGPILLAGAITGAGLAGAYIGKYAKRWRVVVLLAAISSMLPLVFMPRTVVYDLLGARTNSPAAGAANLRE